ncbi:MAG: hypothetical protein ACLFSC_09520 [Wenzhouxiangella sp.]
MFVFDRSTASAEPILTSQSDPRLRRTLGAELGKATAPDIHRLSWLYWLLRTRQPRNVLVSEPVDDRALLMTAAAISTTRGARLMLRDRPISEQLLSSLTEAGLEWVLRRTPASIDQVHDAMVVQGGSSPDHLLGLLPRLAAGALVVVLDPGPTDSSVQRAWESLIEREPGLETLMLAPSTMPVLTMIWRGH